MEIAYMIYLAIDPGLHGGLAWLTPDGAFAEATPLLKAEGKNEYDVKTMWLHLDGMRREGPTFAILEKVHAMPKQGVSSTFKFGYGFGLWVALLTAAEIPFELVSPQAWKKVMLADTPKDKLAALVTARRLFPTVDLHRKADDGLAEALLMAEYGRRQQGPH